MVADSPPVLYDEDYLSIYDGPDINSPLLVHLTSAQNDFTRYLGAKAFNSKSSTVFILFHTQSVMSSSSLGAATPQKAPIMHGFNLTYQIKGKLFNWTKLI